MKVCIFLIGLFLGSALNGGQALVAQASSPKGLLEKADQCAKRLYASRNRIKYRHHWMACLDAYRDVTTRYPESDESVWALYRVAGMFEKLHGYSGRGQDLDDAVEVYRRVAHDFETHRLADDAQYRIGEIYLHKKEDLTRAYLEFLKVELQFPQGDMRPRAQKMIDKITAIISERENRKELKETFENAPGLTQVQQIRHWSTPSYTRVVIDLERAVPFQSNLLEEDKDRQKPRRLYLDLGGTYVSPEIESTIPIRDGVLRNARAAQYAGDTVRVVLDIDQIDSYKVFPLHDPFRIVIDLRGGSGELREAPHKVAAVAGPVRKGVRKAGEPDSSVSLARQFGLSVRRIVIDPGHGGKDPGTYFKGGIKEKNVVLMLAQILAGKIEEKLGCEAVLTRDKDVFMSLEKRTAFANMQKADLFVSLHINAHKQAGVRGLETYYLNMATDERAVLVAARENATSEKNISDLQSILNDLMLNTKISESSRLAHEVQRGMMGYLGRRYRDVKNLGVKQAPFYVLIGAEMPAVLVETGFITNPAERKRLQSRAYLETLAEGIVAGMQGYIRSISLTAMGG